MEMDNPFARVKSIVNRLRDVLKCQNCLEMKNENSMLFYNVCDHFYCSDCIDKNNPCNICENPLDKPKEIIDDKSLLSLYQSLKNFELPSKNEIDEIYKSCLKAKENTRIESYPNDDQKSTKKSKFIESKGEGQKNSGEKKTKNESKIIEVEELEKSKKKQSSLTNEEKNNVTPSSLLRNKTSSKRNKTNTPLTSRSVKARKSHLTPSSSDKNSTPLHISASTSFETTTPAKSPLSTSNKTPVTTSISTSVEAVGGSGKSKSGSKLNINKRNPKGETQLHLASKKSNLVLMKELIDAGADPNAKDNAGWTPLHDSVFSGKTEVIRFLLENGAKVNVPGLDNTTALHEAITEGSATIVKLLLEFGADVNALNLSKETPMDLVNKYNLTDLKELLMDYSKTLNSSTSNENEDTMEDVKVYKHNLTIEDEKLVNLFAQKFNIHLCSSLLDKVQPTHIIVSSNKFEITWGIISAVVNGSWLVKVNWVQDSYGEGKLKAATAYELPECPGFAKSRANIRNQLPGLFSGCHFYFGGDFDLYSVKSLTVKKEELKNMIQKNNGIILKRCPDPESLALEKTIPYHAKASGSLRETAYFIIYQSGKWEPQLKYNMAHMRTLSVDWLLSCIYKFELIDPKEFKEFEFL